MEAFSWSIQWTLITAPMKSLAFVYLANVICCNRRFWFPTQMLFSLELRCAAEGSIGQESKCIPRWCWGRYPLGQRRGLLPAGGWWGHVQGLPFPLKHFQSQGLWGVRSCKGWGGEDWMFSVEGDKINWYFSERSAAFDTQPSRSCEVVEVLLQLIQ